MTELEKQTIIMDRLIASLKNDMWEIQHIDLFSERFKLELRDITPDIYKIKVKVNKYWEIFRFDKSLKDKHLEACELASKLMHKTWEQDRHKHLDGIIEDTK